MISGYFYLALLAVKAETAKYETGKYSFDFSHTINGHLPLVCWYTYRQKPTLER